MDNAGDEAPATGEQVEIVCTESAGKGVNKEGNVEAAEQWDYEDERKRLKLMLGSLFFLFAVCLGALIAVCIIYIPRSCLQGVTNTWFPQTKLLASDGTANDRFGSYVSVAGNRTVVGAPFARNKTGAVYVFEISVITNKWEEQAILTVPGMKEGELFGEMIVSEGNTVVVGSHRYNNYTGGVFVFEMAPDGTWEQVARLTAPDGSLNDQFGKSVAMNNGTIVVGAWGEDINGIINVGAVYTFEKDSNQRWVFKSKLLPPSPSFKEYFGSALSIHKDTMVVGSRGFFNKTGRAYIYKKGASGWALWKRMFSPYPEEQALFGYSVSVFDGTYVIGAQKAKNESGRVDIYQEFPCGELYHMTQLSSPEGQGGRFGTTATIIDDTILIGGYYEDTVGENAGASYIYKRGWDWYAYKELTVQNPADRDYLGVGGAMAPGFAAVGASGDDDLGSHSGAVFIFATGFSTTGHRANSFGMTSLKPALS
uniref:Uncharacterized protein n=1 Tax=Mucochytrium quahogii TaxID=96639 RepID=A0A7S2WHY7_9STRA